MQIILRASTKTRPVAMHGSESLLPFSDQPLAQGQGIYRGYLCDNEKERPNGKGGERKGGVEICESLKGVGKIMPDRSTRTTHAEAGRFIGS